MDARFTVERKDGGIMVVVDGRPETEEFFTDQEFRTSNTTKIANSYVERHVGARDVVGNKAGTLGNKFRALLRGEGYVKPHREVKTKTADGGIDEEIEMPRNLASRWALRKLRIVEEYGPFDSYDQARRFRPEAPVEDGERLIVEGIYEDESQSVRRKT